MLLRESSKIMIGETEVKRVFCRGKAVYVWKNEPNGYWVHKDTNEKTYFNIGNLDYFYMSGRYLQFPTSVIPYAKEVVLMDGIQTIGHRCFNNSIFPTINLPNTVIELDHYAFDSSGLVSLNMPNSIIVCGT